MYTKLAKYAGKSMSKKQTNHASFEETLKALELIVTRLESGGLSLDESLNEFERGIKLAREGKQQLHCAEQRIQILLNENTDAELVEFIVEKE